METLSSSAPETPDTKVLDILRKFTHFSTVVETAEAAGYKARLSQFHPTLDGVEDTVTISIRESGQILATWSEHTHMPGNEAAIVSHDTDKLAAFADAMMRVLNAPKPAPELAPVAALQEETRRRLTYDEIQSLQAHRVY